MRYAFQCLALILAVTFIFGLAGCGIAAILARLVPGYYPGIFPQAQLAGIDPAEVGMGLGVTQGIIAGLFVSLALLALQSWRSYRTRLQVLLEEINIRLDELERAVLRLQLDKNGPAKG